MRKNETIDLKLTNNYMFVDDEFIQLIKDLCDEIDKTDTELLSTVSLLSKIPYELAMCVIENIKYRKADYIGLINTFYYDEFNEGIKEKDANKKSKFQNRLTSQKEKKYEQFAVERLLTVGEIENLIKLFIEEGKMNVSLEDILSGKSDVCEKRLKILIKAHRFITKKSNDKINREIMSKMNKFWLTITLCDIKNIKQTKGLSL